jgi:hypothetical protein
MRSNHPHTKPTEFTIRAATPPKGPKWMIGSSLPRSQVTNLHSSFGSLLACLMSAETTVCVSFSRRNT